MNRTMLQRMAVVVLFGAFFAFSASAQGTKVQLRYAHWGSEDEKASTAATLQAFMKENPDVAVEQMYIPESGDSYVQKMSAMAASGTLPDAALFPDAYSLTWGLKGTLLDLSDIFTGVHDKVDSIKYILPNGKLIAVAGAQEIMLLWYNKDIFDKAGVAYPPASGEKAWTWSQFVDVAKKLTKDTNGKTAADAGFDPSKIDRYGAQLPTWDMPLQTFMQSNGGQVFSKDWKAFTLNTPANAAALQAIADLMNKDHAIPQATSSMDTSTGLLTGKVAMVMDGQWSLETLNRVRKESGLNFGIGVLPYFKRPVTTATGGPIVAFSSSKNPALAKKLVSFIMDPANTPAYITGGLWMPNEKRWYKDPNLIEQWIKNDNHPAEYRTAVLDYSLKFIGTQMGTFRVPNYPGLWSIVSPSLDKIWLGQATAAQALAEADPKAQAYFASQILPLMK